MKVGAVIQARTGSTRLPAKVLKKMCGKPILSHVIDRAKACKLLDEIIIATTVNPADDRVVEIAVSEGVKTFRGSETDVLARYYGAAKENGLDVIVRITSDNPLLDFEVIDRIISKLIEEKADYSCNNMPPSFPYGLDVECFTYAALEDAFLNAVEPREREHVTPYIREHQKFRRVNVLNENDESKLRWTVDTQEDFDYVNQIYEALYEKNRLFTRVEIMEHLKERG